MIAGRTDDLQSVFRGCWNSTSSNEPAGFDIMVNAPPLGTAEVDPLLFDVGRIRPAHLWVRSP